MSPLYTAVQDFRRARRRADLEQIIGRLRGVPVDLLPFEQVRQKLKITSTSGHTLKDIPLDAIVGSVGRYSDFTRSFLPKQNSDVSRWAMVMIAATDYAGLPPIEAYQIGDVYFVQDGNHRVSVARELNAATIQAYVTELKTKVILTPDLQPDDLILKAEYAEFLDNTKLDKLRPKADITVTVPGKYKELEEHIAVHRYFMGIDFKREITPEEAVIHWYDTVYMPVVRAIRDRGILRDFPRRTEADLYLWVSEHRAALQGEFRMEIPTAEAAADLASRRSFTPRKIIARLGEKLSEIFVPYELDAGPKPGIWRREHLFDRQDETLFLDILVPVSGLKEEWNALECALEIAQREGSHLYGLYIVKNEKQINSQGTKDVQRYFDQRCAETNVTGKLNIQIGNITHQICDRARWVDLVALNLAHPPSAARLARLSSGLRTVIRRCSRPILAIPGKTKYKPSKITRALLAYGGNLKAEEALFVATYISSTWALHLDVLIIGDPRAREILALQERAYNYLKEHSVEATFVKASGHIDEQIIHIAQQRQSDMIIMGGYESHPIVEVFMGSSVDGVLRKTRKPVLICR
jgi:nucleotide-binding universal stress UspA family protein